MKNTIAILSKVAAAPIPGGARGRPPSKGPSPAPAKDLPIATPLRAEVLDPVVAAGRAAIRDTFYRNLGEALSPSDTARMDHLRRIDADSSWHAPTKSREADRTDTVNRIANDPRFPNAVTGTARDAVATMGDPHALSALDKKQSAAKLLRKFLHGA